MEEMVLPSELTCRFITQRKWYRTKDKTVKHNAFMPNKNREVSLYRTTGLGEAQIYEIGQRYVADMWKKSLLGRAEIVVSNILKHGLRVQADPNPHPRHANIVDWPEDESKHRMIAIEVATDAQLHLINV